MNIIETISKDLFFKRYFKDISTWKAWMVFLKGLFGIPLQDEAELALFKQCTGLKEAPGRAFRESYVICGRRSGKSFISAIVAVFLATFKNWKPYLSPGKKGWVFIIATDRDQAKIVMSYISGIMNGNEIFKKMIKKESVWEIELTNNVNIGIKTCSFRTVRGFTVLAAICEEIAFWRDENSANPALEVLAALRPALATIPESMLIAISTPYSRSGVLWEQFKSNYGKEDANSLLVWKAPTRVMNPTISFRTIENAMMEDPERAKAEWEAEWREDVEAFFSLNVLEAAVAPGRFELPKLRDTNYFGFIDPSGGRQDSFTLAICHKEENGKIILDCIREALPPFMPQSVTWEFCEVLQSYGVTYVESDRYSGEWVVSEFGKHGIVVENSELSSSEIYLSFLPLLMNGSVELLEKRRLLEQLRGLERKTRAGGRDLISHGPFSGAHDDLAIAVAGAVVRASRHEEMFSPEILARMMFPEPKLSREERLKKYVTNWLLDRPQKRWTAEDDMED